MKPRAFAIVPAAGHSVRMGQPKLLIDLAGKPLVRHVLDAWRQSKVEAIVVVMRQDDAALAAVVAAAGAGIVMPATDPPDMKSSIRCGLEFIELTYQPQPHDVWLVAPADMPGLSPKVIDLLIAGAEEMPGRILIPTLAGLSGHPVLLPWPLAKAVENLHENEGLNALLAAHDPLLLPCDVVADETNTAFADLDTPDDLASFREQAKKRPPPANS